MNSKKTAYLVLHIIGFNIITVNSYCFDLLQAFESAMVYNPNYKALIAKSEAGTEIQKQSKSALLPQVNGTTTIAENYLNAGMTVYYHQPTASVQLQQVVLDFRKFSQYSKSKFATGISELQMQLAKQQLYVDVAQAYFDVLLANDMLEATRAEKTSFLNQLSQANKLFKAGIVTITDINDAQASYDLAVVQEIQDKNNLLNKQNILRDLTGLNPSLVSPLIANIKILRPEPDDLNKYLNFVRVNNLNVLLLQKQLEMAKLDINIAQASHLPSVNLSANYQYQGGAAIDGTDSQATQNILIQSANVPGSFLSSYKTANVGLAVNLPIYSGGSINSQIRQAQSNYRVAEQQLISGIRKAEQDATNFYLQVNNGSIFIQAQAQALKSAKLKLDYDQIGYLKVGNRNSTNLSDSKKDYFKTFKNYNNSRYQYLINMLQLKFMAGQINTQFLSTINTNIKKLSD